MTDPSTQRYAYNPLNRAVKVPIHKTRKHDVVITDWKTGKEIFRQEGVEAPEHWSDTAINIACSRWFRGKLGTPEREVSTHQMFERVASAICNFGAETGHIAQEDLDAWIDYLVAIQQDQRAVFNTPVYLNAGWTDNPRTSACFLIPVEDNYESLTQHTQVEARVFQHGGGAGVYVGNVSHEGRALSKGGYASGPLCFNEGWDRSSGAIKSGGSHRRAARDVTMDIRHPDCFRSADYLKSLPVSALDTDFIREKQIFEQIRKDLASLGHDVGMNTIVDYMLPAQNANRAVLVYDEFLNAVKEDGEWDVCDPRTGERVWTYMAREVWDALCYATWYAADPTIKFFDNINEYNMCRNGRLTLPDGTVLDIENMEIVCSNPCNEVIYPVPPVSGALISCNLAMLRLTKYKKGRAGFDVEAYVADAQFMLTLQDILVDYSDYPTELGTQWTRANRILGLSLSDLGGLLMSMGIPYDSDKGRLYAEAVAALHFYAALNQSAYMASVLGPCENYERNKGNVARVLDLHRKHLDDLNHRATLQYDDKALAIVEQASLLCAGAMTQVAQYGLRNMQVVSYAPQGTTGMITDCFSTGPEPMIAPISYKTLSGGGTITQAPQVVKEAIEYVLQKHFEREGYHEHPNLGVYEYVESYKDAAFDHLIERGTLDGFINNDYDDIFATALGIHTKEGVKLSIHPNGHVDMLGVLQRFVSGAISKSVNLPSISTVADISDIYMRAWEKGVKAISIYRDGSKGAQPVKIKLDEEVDQEVHDEQQDILALTQEVERLKAELAKQNVPVKATRVKLPDNVPSLRKKIRLDGHEIYMHVGLYENGSVGEVFLTGVQGSFVAGMLDSFATLLSLGFQYGVPFEDLYRKFEAVSFAPQGWYGEIQGYASSLPSLILKLLKKGLEDGAFKRYAENFYGKKITGDSTFLIDSEQKQVKVWDYVLTFNEEREMYGKPRYDLLEINEAIERHRKIDPSFEKRFADFINTQKDLTDADQEIINDFVEQELKQQPVQQKTSDPCPVCGSLMVRTGKCKTCVSCSYSDGGCG